MFLYSFLLPLAATSFAAYTWPHPVMDELEHLLVDTGGFNDGTFKRAITPCSNYVSGPQTLGRETAAQWIRVSFHDFSTADVAAGTGGMDASIGFETLRAENSGSAMNDSLGFFAPFVNARRSMADMIALSVVMSIGACSSPTISVPLRGGRIDATAGGEFGVPEPETDIEETLAQFRKAGFNHEDAIGLTACGHTMGSVHHGGFPQVVDESAVTPNNTGGGIHFDATADVFDINVVNEYLSGTGQRGGPLITTANETVRSDLRMYTSDSNSTMRSLASSNERFISTCIALFSKMLNTVPSTTTLSDVIAPNNVKPVNVSLSLTSDGQVSFSGYIRLLSITEPSSDTNVTISWLDANKRSSSNFNVAATFAGTGSSIFGPTSYHRFSTTLSPTGISSFQVHVHQGSSVTDFSNGRNGYSLESTAFFLPKESGVDNDGSASIAAAVLTTAGVQNVTGVVQVPSPQSGTLSPKITRSTISLNSNSTAGLYTIYTGTITIPVPIVNLGQVSVDILAQTKRGTVLDEFRFLRSTVV